MVTLSQTNDWELIKKIITDPCVYPHVSDDAAPTPETFYPAPGLLYILVSTDKPVGLFACACSAAQAEIHTCLLPECYGEAAAEAANSVARWIWDHTKLNRIITNVPEYNRLALRFAKKAGMTEFGVNEKSYLKRGQFHDQIMLGLTRPEITCQ